jgi:CheY-like chemotaxis protein
MADTSSVVLLIEPKDESRAAHTDALRGAGFTVVAVADCRAGLYALSELTPQIIVASVNPETHDECLTLCERLRADPRTKAVPILLTAETITTEGLERAADMKVLGIAVGPHDEAKITGAVRGVLAVSAEHTSMSPPERHVSRSA